MKQVMVICKVVLCILPEVTSPRSDPTSFVSSLPAEQSRQKRCGERYGQRAANTASQHVDTLLVIESSATAHHVSPHWPHR
jgi:hypothetical protein